MCLHAMFRWSVQPTDDARSSCIDLRQRTLNNKSCIFSRSSVIIPGLHGINYKEGIEQGPWGHVLVDDVSNSGGQVIQSRQLSALPLRNDVS